MKIKKGKLDIILNILCLILLTGTSVFLVVYWNDIPNQVPLHYDFAGKVNRIGSKNEYIVVVAIGWIIYILMTVIERFPGIWNTGIEVTEENREKVYATLLHFISSLKFIIICIFTYLTIKGIFSLQLSAWFTPIYLLLIFGDMGYWVFRLLKLR